MMDSVLSLPTEEFGPHSTVVCEWEDVARGISGRTHAAAVSSATSGLMLALRASGVRRGDTVVVPSLTFCATAQAVLAIGARPWFVDVDRDTFLVTDKTLEAALEAPGTSAIVPVHLFGAVANLPRTRKRARHLGIAIVEDAAQAFGSGHNRRDPIGGDRTAVYSFAANKQVPLGHGGMVVTHDQRIDSTVRHLRHNGIEETGLGWVATEQSQNHEHSGLVASVAVAQKALIEKMLAVRTRAGKELDLAATAFADSLQPQRVEDPEHRVPHRWAFRTKSSSVRERLVRLAPRFGLRIGRLYPPVHLHPVFHSFGRTGELSGTATFHREGLVLEFRASEADMIVERFIDAARAARA